MCEHANSLRQSSGPGPTLMVPVLVGVVAAVALAPSSSFFLALGLAALGFLAVLGLAFLALAFASLVSEKRNEKHV